MAAKVFENEQWVVLEDGVEAKKGVAPYDFAIDRVFELTTRGQRSLYDWPVHMASKTWVDVGLFNEAFERAIRFYSNASGQEIDEQMLTDSFAEAHRVRAQQG